MKTGLLFLPFLALLVGAITTAVGASLPQLQWVQMAGWIAAAAVIGVWVVLDFAGFRQVFARRGAKYGASSGLVVLFGIAIIVGIGVLSTRQRFNKSFDATKSRTNTLADQSIKIVTKINEKAAELKIIGFFQDNEMKESFRSLMRLYANAGAQPEVEYVNPDTDPLRAKSEKLTSGNTVIFRLGSQESRITTFSEEKITNAFVKILKEGSKKVCFSKGHGEGELRSQSQPEPQGYDIVVQILENNKYEVTDYSILENVGKPIPCDAMVIAGPTYDLKAEEAIAVEKYVENGGGLFVMVDALKPIKNLRGLVEKFGIAIEDDLVFLNPQDPVAQQLGQFTAIVTDFDTFHPVTKDFGKDGNVALLLPNTRTVDKMETLPAGVKVDIIGKTVKGMLRLKNVHSEEDLRAVDPSRFEPGSFGVIAVATVPSKSAEVAHKGNGGADKTDSPGDSMPAPKARESRVVVVGSGQAAQNQIAQAGPHRDMFANVVNYLLQDEDSISIRPKDQEKSTLRLAAPGSDLTLRMLTLVYPFLFLGFGVVHWLRRRNA